MGKISDALPIQFWPIDTDTFNEQVNGFVDMQPFTQEFQMDDMIKFQVGYEDDFTKTYQLKILDPASVIVETIPFVKTLLPYGNNLDFENPSFLTSIGINWQSFDGSDRAAVSPWVYSGVDTAAEIIAAGFQDSKYFAVNRIIDPTGGLGWPPGTYVVRIHVRNDSIMLSGSGSITIGLNVWGMVNSTGETAIAFATTLAAIPSDSTYHDVDLTFTITHFWPYLAFTANRIASGGNFSLRVRFQSVHIINAIKDQKAEYDLNFIAPAQLAVDPLPPITSWGNIGAGISWINSPNVKVHFTSFFTTSKYWQTDFSLVPGCIYKIHWKTIIAPFANYVRIVSLDLGAAFVETLYDSSATSEDRYITLAPTLYGAKLAIIAQSDDFNGSEDVTINQFDFLEFKNNFYNSCVKFVIQSNGVDVFKSDYIKFSASVVQGKGWGSHLIQYNSIKNYAGINYPNDSSYFSLRVPCRFFKNRPKTVQENLQLADKTIVTGSVKGSQRLIDTILLPDYMHNKIQLALEHSVSGKVLIDDKLWVLEETYDLNDVDPKAPFQMAKVWLTDKNYLIRNMI